MISGDFVHAWETTNTVKTAKEEIKKEVKAIKKIQKAQSIETEPPTTDTIPEDTSSKDVLSNTGTIENNESTDTTEELTDAEKEQVKKEINEYIIDSYKVQGSKILKDLDIKLQSALPETEERIEAYGKILQSLELRKKRVENMKASETKKLILNEFLSHMISGIKKKIESLQN